MRAAACVLTWVSEDDRVSRRRRFIPPETPHVAPRCWYTYEGYRASLLADQRGIGLGMCACLASEKAKPVNDSPHPREAGKRPTRRAAPSSFLPSVAFQSPHPRCQRLATIRGTERVGAPTRFRPGHALPKLVAVRFFRFDPPVWQTARVLTALRKSGAPTHTHTHGARTERPESAPPQTAAHVKTPPGPQNRRALSAAPGCFQLGACCETLSTRRACRKFRGKNEPGGGGSGGA
ncbi:hypothetical protein BD414DRAFT_265110 [Trametes punicea]|nr:hypothetical protein BD414DRAFT_265110 [Trametes punicea]